jgi:hypothetical protein
MFSRSVRALQHHWNATNSSSVFLVWSDCTSLTSSGFGYPGSSILSQIKFQNLICLLILYLPPLVRIKRDIRLWGVSELYPPTGGLSLQKSSIPRRYSFVTSLSAVAFSSAQFFSLSKACLLPRQESSDAAGLPSRSPLQRA